MQLHSGIIPMDLCSKGSSGSNAVHVAALQCTGSNAVHWQHWQNWQKWQRRQHWQQCSARGKARLRVLEKQVNRCPDATFSTLLFNIQRGRAWLGNHKGWRAQYEGQMIADLI
jgi:hypothetical protein